METPQSQARNSDSQEPTVQITIGGSVGHGNAIGVRSSVQANNIVEGSYTSAEDATREDFIALLHDLQEQIHQLSSYFDAEDVTDAQDALSKAEQISKRDNPPLDRLQQNLETVKNIVEDTAKVGTVLTPLTMLIQQAFTLFSHVFGR